MCLYSSIFFLSIYLAVQVVVAACRLFSCGLWDLVPRPGTEPRPPVLAVPSLSHWTTKEVPWEAILDDPPTCEPFGPMYFTQQKRKKSPICESVSPTQQQAHQGGGYALCTVKYPVSHASVQFSALPFSGCVSLGKLLNLPVPQFFSSAQWRWQCYFITVV